MYLDAFALEARRWEQRVKRIETEDRAQFIFMYLY